MSQHDDTQYQLDTLAIRTGHTRSFEGEHSEPIFLTSSFVYANAAEAAAKAAAEAPAEEAPAEEAPAAEEAAAE